MKNNSVKSNNHSKKHISIIGTFIICICILFACTSVCLPKLFLDRHQKKNLDKVNVVPTEYYSGPSVAVVKSASRQLSFYQKLQLITNVWDSNISIASKEECSISEYEAYTLAAGSIFKLHYNKGLYPELLNSEYENWYSWKATPYKAVDTTFGIYAAIYWEIVFTRYDSSETHTVIIDENGEVLYALAVGKEEYSDYEPHINETVTELSVNNISKDIINNYHISVLEDNPDTKIVSYTDVKGTSNELYNYYIIKGDDCFGIFITP